MDGGVLPVKLQPSNLRPIAYRILSKKHGLNIQTDGLKQLTEIISYKFGSEWKEWKSQTYLEEIAKAWKNQDKGLFIDGEGLKEIVKQLDGDKQKLKRDTKPSIVRDVSDAGGSEPLEIDDYEANKENEDEINWRDYFRFLNPDQLPNYKFDKQRKQFFLKPSAKPGSRLAHFIDSNIDTFAHRYHIIKDRLSRNELFKKQNYQSISTIMEKQLNNEITLIKNVIGRDRGKFILFGLLLQNSQGNFVLEDSSDSIELNLEQAEKADNAFLNLGMFVTVEGMYSQFNQGSANGIFYVSSIAHPPGEKRDVGIDAYGEIDFLNINQENLQTLSHVSKINKQFRKRLAKLETKLTFNKIVVVGSNLYLDKLNIMKGLKKFLTKLETDLVNEEPESPICLILIGSFVSTPISPVHSSISNISNSEAYKNNFNSFVNMLSAFPTIVAKVKIALIPGPNDPWQSAFSLGGSNLNYYPQSPVPEVFLNRLERLLPKGNLIRAWNPLRINYLSQEIVIFNDDIVNKFKRNEILLDSDIKQINDMSLKSNDPINIVSSNNVDNIPPRLKQERKLVRTLLDQGNLQPFSKDLKLINPVYDNCLRIDPLPHIIILNDSNYESFEISYCGCKVINLKGMNDRFNYVEYFPATKQFKFQHL